MAWITGTNPVMTTMTGGTLPGHDADAGFTLVEVLVALAILAIAFGFAFRALSGGFDRLDRDQKNADALLLAQSTLARVGHDIALADGAVDGRTNDGFWWQIATAPYGDTQDLPPGRLIGHRVEVTIAWSERHQRREVRLTSLLIAPKEQGP
jgi:general secretion pathway protein I